MIVGCAAIITCVALASRSPEPVRAMVKSPRMSFTLPATGRSRINARRDAVCAQASHSNKLQWLVQHTEVVPDAFSMEGVDYQPRSGTVNSNMILRMMDIEGLNFIEDEIRPAVTAMMSDAMFDSYEPEKRLKSERRHLYAIVASKLLARVSGKVSMEIDPRVAYDTAAILDEVRVLAEDCKRVGIDVYGKIIFKIPGTKNGIDAAGMLTREGFCCQVTHIYSLAQAIAATDAGVAIVQPMVGRVNDWHKTHPDKVSSYQATSRNPGIDLVKNIFAHIKKQEKKTKIMAASIRNAKDALSIAGVDLMVINPAIIQSLAADSSTDVPVPLNIKDQPDRYPKEMQSQDFGQCAEELIDSELRRATESVLKVEDTLANTVLGG